MKKNLKMESGFTLIEALVAFLIVAIGLAGAALFHSELIAESGASKARSIAVKLAEKELEERRVLITDTHYDDLDTVVLAAVPVVTSVTVGNTIYDVSFSAESTVSATAETHYLLSATVDWDDAKGSAESVALSTHLSRNDPESSLDNSEQAGTAESNPNVEQIERPSGAAVAIARETTERDITSTDIGDYIRLGEDKYGIKTAETSCDEDGSNCTKEEVVSVIELIKTTSPIFKITGNIYFHDTPDNDFNTVEASPNVLTSEGGGCAVYQIPSTSQAAYTCLFGEGWYGMISLVLPLENNGRPADTVCLSPREYKYYRIDPEGVSGSDIQSSDIIGQSGLVRFTSSTGDGPYLASDYATPGLGYYFLYGQMNDDVASSNVAGNIENQHFVVTDNTGNDSGDMNSICIQDGGTDSEPLFSDSIYDQLSVYPDLNSDNYGYYDGVSDVEIPDDNIIMGYVNVAYEITGSIDVSSVAATADDLFDELEVGMDELPLYGQVCTKEVIGEQSIKYSCFVDHGWDHKLSVSTADGSSYSFTFTPTAYDFSGNTPDTGELGGDPVTSDVAGKNFMVEE